MSVQNPNKKIFDHKAIEKKWQNYWEKNETNKTPNKAEGKQNYYTLVEFPYPSGNLHVGHWYAFAVTDIFARFQRMLGKNVLYPIGFDAFGLPAENAAIKRNINPRDWTEQNIAHMSKQLKSMGAMFDWSRMVKTIDPNYYKWTQWMFIQFMKAGLAEQKSIPANWCPSCKTVLANEQVINGKCERCDSEVEKKDLKQWTLKITKYADRLIDDLDELDWPEEIKKSQKEWIGRSEGAEIDFPVKGREEEIKVFTTRPDTIFGATYMVLAPEHELVQKWLKEGAIENKDEVESYIKEAKKKSEIERTNAEKEKSGVELKGIKAINPAIAKWQSQTNAEGTQKDAEEVQRESALSLRESATLQEVEIPVFIADYVLAHYGTGAIMAVPAHDERDFEFAKKYNLPVPQVVAPVLEDITNPEKETVEKETVIVIATDENEENFLVLDWEKYGWHSFIIGELQEGETYEDAALRKLKEESGYENVELVRQIGYEVRGNYYAEHKGVNKYAKIKAFLIKVKDKENREPKELEHHKALWLPKDKVANFLNKNSYKYFWDIYTGEKPEVYTDRGVLINSGPFNGSDNEEAKQKIVDWLGAKMTKTYRLRDWAVSRQRYWGVPIPVVHCDNCGAVPEKQENLPVLLPEVEDYLPSDDGRSPLAKVEEFVNTTCTVCGAPAKRETDTLDTFVDSSWYFLRYIDPHNEKEFSSKQSQELWMPVDFYSGGAEHTTMHLLYSRFWQKALFDLGLVKDSEPYKRRLNRGLIMGPDGNKMSKSKGNVIDPDEVVEQVGSDTVRGYLAFIGPYNEPGHYPWNPDGVVSIRRFLERVYGLQFSLLDSQADSQNTASLSQKNADNASHSRNDAEEAQKDAEGVQRESASSPRDSATSQEVEKLLHKTIKKVREDSEKLKFNTAISAMMVFVKEADKKGLTKDQLKTFVKLIAPFAPHIAEELWQEVLGEKESVHLQSYPDFDPEKVKADVVKVAVQVNGKVRGEIEISPDAPEEEVKELALADKNVQKHMSGKEIKKFIYVPGRVINIVI